MGQPAFEGSVQRHSFSKIQLTYRNSGFSGGAAVPMRNFLQAGERAGSS